METDSVNEKKIGEYLNKCRQRQALTLHDAVYLLTWKLLNTVKLVFEIDYAGDEKDQDRSEILRWVECIESAQPFEVDQRFFLPSTDILSDFMLQLYAGIVKADMQKIRAWQRQAMPKDKKSLDMGMGEK
jgi:hypothetical protein